MLKHVSVSRVGSEVVGSWRKLYTKVYPKVSRLAAWSKNCKWYSSLPV